MLYIYYSEKDIKPYDIHHNPFHQRKVEPTHKNENLIHFEEHLDNQISKPSAQPHQKAEIAYEEAQHNFYQKNKNLLAKEIMTSPVITLSVTKTINDAWQMIRTHHHRHLPIINENKELSGLISDRDLYRHALHLNHFDTPVGSNHHENMISTIMNTPVITAYADTLVRLIAGVLFKEHIGSIPILNKNYHVIGIITRSDILKAVMNQAPMDFWV